MPIDLAGLPVEIGFILAHAATAHEFERELYVRKADRHRATSEYLIKDVDRAPGIRASPARRTVKPALVIVKTRFWLPGRFLSRRFPGGLEKVLSSTGDRGFESTSLQRRVTCKPRRGRSLFRADPGSRLL